VTQQLGNGEKRWDKADFDAGKSDVERLHDKKIRD
jgi:hypothetical protein